VRVNMQTRTDEELLSI